MASRCVLLIALVTSCSDDLDLSNRDPRCVAACPETMPPIDGVGDVCSEHSRVVCLDDCESRIAGVTSPCATCLTEMACFQPGGCDGDTTSIQCNQTTCTITGWAGMCMYPPGNPAAEVACEKQVSPRRDVECTPMFRPSAQCATYCM